MLRELLREAGPAEPPPYLVDDILVAVAAESAGRSGRPSHPRGPVGSDAGRAGRLRRRRRRLGLGFAGMAAGGPVLAAAGRAGGTALLRGFGAARGALASREARETAAPRRGTKALSLVRRLLARRRNR